MKIMLLQHTIRYHKAQDWILLQDPATLTYKSLLHHCKQLEQCCKQFQKAQLKGRAELTSLTVTSTRTSIHQDSISTHPKHNNCYRCRYSHTNRDYPAIGQRCHICNGMNHFSALCRARNYREYREYDRQCRHSQREPYKSRNCSRSSSRSSSRSPTRSTSHHRCTRRHRSPTPHHIDTITIAGPNKASNSNTKFNKSSTPIPSPLATFPTFSDTEDPDNTASEASIVIHSQDEDDFSTDYNAISPPRNYHILMTPPKTHRAMLPRPSCITEANDTQDQDSTAYSELPISDTETESSYTLQPEDTNFSPLQDHIAHLPRPSCSPRPTRKHLRPHFNKSQQFMNKTYIKKTKPSCIPVPKDTKNTKNSHLTMSTDLQKPSSPTPPNTQTTMKQPTPPTPRTLTASTHPQWTRKIPLLPTPPASARQFNNRNHYKQHIPRPSPIYNRFHQQQYIPRPFNHQQLPLLPLQSHQIPAFPGPHQQTPGHLTLQVSYIPVLLPYPSQLITLLQYYTA